MRLARSLRVGARVDVSAVNGRLFDGEGGHGVLEEISNEVPVVADVWEWLGDVRRL